MLDAHDMALMALLVRGKENGRGTSGRGKWGRRRGWLGSQAII
jgi:hypothetical protein